MRASTGHDPRDRSPTKAWKLEARSPRLTNWMWDTVLSAGYKRLRTLRGSSPDRPYLPSLGRLVHVAIGSCVLGIAAPAVVVSRTIRVVVVVASVALRTGQ